MHLGKNLKQLRQKKGMTQEQLAAALFVSYQTISKWEREDADPDIQMLIRIAKYFHCSIDELIGYGEDEEKETVSEISSEWESNHSRGKHVENEILIRQSLKSYPNNYILMIELAATLENLPDTDDDRERHLRESIQLQETIIKECKEPDLWNAARYNICFSYWKVGDKETAIKKASELPSYYKTRENALLFFIKGEEKAKISKEALDSISYALIRHLLVLGESFRSDEYIRKANSILNDLEGDISDEMFSKLQHSIQKRKGV